MRWLLVFAFACSETPSATDGGLVDAEPLDALLADTGIDTDSGLPDTGALIGLPDGLRMTAEAMGVFTSSTSTTTTTVQCNLDFIWEIREETSRTADSIEYRGVQGGEIFRSLLAPDGSGTAFFADSYGEITATLTQPDQLRLRIPINDTADGHFWRELATFEGTRAEDGTFSGQWTCAPFDIEQGGYVDNQFSATGTWVIVPEHIEHEPPEDAG